MKLQVYRLQIAERAYRFGQCADKIDSLNGAIAQQVSSLSNANQGVLRRMSRSFLKQRRMSWIHSVRHSERGNPV